MQAVKKQKLNAKQTPPKNLTLSTILLIAMNVALIVQAVMFDWHIGTMVWIYWMQGLAIVLIGFVASRFNLWWIILLGILAFYGVFMMAFTFPSESSSYSINGQPVSAEEFTIFAGVAWGAVWFNTLALALNHLISYALDGEKARGLRSAGKVVKRIIPLHLIIVLATFIPLPVVFFMVFKSIADVIAHNMQHHSAAFTKSFKAAVREAQQQKRI